MAWPGEGERRILPPNYCCRQPRARVARQQRTFSQTKNQNMPLGLKGKLGAKLAKKAKKAKKKKKEKKGESAGSSSKAKAGSKRKRAEREEEEQEKAAAAAAAAADEYDSDEFLTEAEKRHKAIKKARAIEVVRKELETSHREKIDKFNAKLAAMSEHHDVPRVANAGLG